MMCISLEILSFVLIIAGVVGCVIPVIPGPILAYGGILCLIPTSHAPSSGTLVVLGCLTLAVAVLDCVIPVLGAKRFNCSKFGTWGCMAGTLLGFFFFPVGLLLGPFCGAFIGELIARKPIRDAAIGGLGAFLGFLSGVLMKTFVCLAMLIYWFCCI